MKTQIKRPTIGQRVFVNYLSVRDAKEGQGYTVKANVSEKEFYSTVPNYLGRLGLRWVVGPIGKRNAGTPMAPYGMAYLPERVFFTEKEAQNDLRTRAQVLIDQIQAALVQQQYEAGGLT